MFNLKDFEQYKGQCISGKATLCWSKKLGYFFLSGKETWVGDCYVIGVEK